MENLAGNDHIRDVLLLRIHECRILAVDDPRILEIPVHPNCKCYIESLSAIVAGTAIMAGTDGVDLYVAHTVSCPITILHRHKQRTQDGINYSEI